MFCVISQSFSDRVVELEVGFEGLDSNTDGVGEVKDCGSVRCNRPIV